MHFVQFSVGFANMSLHDNQNSASYEQQYDQHTTSEVGYILPNCLALLILKVIYESRLSNNGKKTRQTIPQGD
jgi:hypothetical protein